MAADFRLRVFVCAARTLNFNKAAAQLCLSQPAVSKHIKALEELYGMRLFERTSGSRLTLTAAGLTLLSHAEKILACYEDLSYDLHLLNHEETGKLRLGASTTIAQYVLPEYLAAFDRLYPDIEISLVNGNSRDIEQAVISHDIELGFVEGVFKSAGLNYTPWLNDELLLVAGSAVPAPKAPVTAETLKELPLVLREHGSGTLDVIAKTLGQAGVKLSALNVRMYLGSTEAIKLFLRHSSCFGIVPSHALSCELQHGSLQVIPLEALRFARTFNLAEAPGPRSPLLQRFLTFLQDNSCSTDCSAAALAAPAVH